MALKTKVVNFRLTEAQYRQARAKAQEEGLTLSQKARWFFAQWIEAQNETPSQEPTEQSQEARR